MASPIARFISGTERATIPAAIWTLASRLFADTFTVALAGADEPGVRAARLLAIEQGGAPQASIWGRAERLPAAEAAYVNGAAAAALDYDAVHPDSILHAEATALPAAIAVADFRHRSGEDALLAYILGAEVMHRLAISTPRRGGWFLSSYLGVFGAAAAAARLLDLDAATIDHALGIAFSFSSGTKQALAEHTLTKRLQTGFAARAGVQAALLAARGVTGPVAWLTGKYGMYQLFETGNADLVTNRLGDDYVFSKTALKKFPSCFACHAAIQATLDLIEEHGIPPGNIKRVEVTISPYMFGIVGAPFFPGDNPQVSAQFSVQYAVAATLRFKRFSLAELNEKIIRDPAIIAAAQAVQVKVNSDWPGQSGPAMVSVTLNNQSSLNRTVERPPGGIDAPITDGGLDIKLRDCLHMAGINEAAHEGLLEALRTLGRQDSIPNFFQLLSGDAA